jgi:hypothetical protein
MARIAMPSHAHFFTLVWREKYGKRKVFDIKMHKIICRETSVLVPDTTENNHNGQTKHK